MKVEGGRAATGWVVEGKGVGGRLKIDASRTCSGFGGEPSMICIVQKLSCIFFCAETERDREIDRDRNRNRNRGRQIPIEIGRDKNRDKQRQRQTETETDRDKDR